MNDILVAGPCLGITPRWGRVVTRLRGQRRWQLMPRAWDYVAQPIAGGYRAKHIVKTKDGAQIEIWLRTAIRHVWAERSSDLTDSLEFAEVRPRRCRSE